MAEVMPDKLHFIQKFVNLPNAVLTWTGDDGAVSASKARDDEAVRRFGEQFGNLLAESGWPRMSARVFTATLFSESGRLTAAELAERLQASPAAISGAVRFLLQLHLIAREREPGSRRDIYTVHNDAWFESILQQDKALARWDDLLRQSLEAAGPETEAGKRIAGTLAFTEFMSIEVAGMLDRWRIYKAEHNL